MALPRQTIKDLGDSNYQGKRVFIRVDFNVPQDKKTGAITDDMRIVEVLLADSLLSRRSISSCVSFFYISVFLLVSSPCPQSNS
jgi:hypothetical protein